MEIIVRPYREGDPIVGIYRDSNNTLRKSRGGLHPDAVVDEAVGRKDADILKELLFGGGMMVAEVKDTGELAGIHAFNDRWINRLLGSAYSRSLYVAGKFQHGKAGVSVGMLLRKAILASARDKGYRKVFGYSTPEAIGFHKKFGAVFFPRYNHKLKGKDMQFHYYEVELRHSKFHGPRLEPYLFDFIGLYLRVIGRIGGVLGRR
jgi:hypothetical protein